MRRFCLVLIAAALVPSCSSEWSPSGADALRDDFPAQADRVLNSNGSLQRRAQHFELAPTTTKGWHNLGVRVQLPLDATQPVHLRSGNFTIKLREEGVIGIAERDGQAVVYQRTNGSSFWMMEGAVAEEWLLLPDGVAGAQEPVARWQVEGATLSEHGDKVAVREEGSGRIRMLTAAPEAYGPRGEKLNVSLKIEGDFIALHVQASAGPVLVDPSWVDYATLVVARGNHASALLTNGNVLATGGDNFGLSSNTAEYYTPSTALWTGIPSMNTQRSFHTATTLVNGNVLVTGGWDGFFPFISTELIDGALTGWTGGPSMYDPRVMHTATALNNNTVLVCGGFFGGGGGEGGGPSLIGGGGGGGPGQQPVDSCEVYDPAISNFAPPVFMFDGRYSHQATLLQNGHAMVCGGWSFIGPTNSCERFNPATNGFLLTGYMLEARTAFSMTRMLDGRVLACGGESFNGITSTCEIYTPTIGTWTPAAPMTSSRTYHSASLLPDGTVLVVGGMDNQFNYLDSVEIYNPVANSWAPGPAITDTRSGHSATTLTNGYIHVSGGHGTQGVVGSSMVYTAAGGNGTPCMMASECGSANCIEGVCCDATCTGVCESCLAAVSGGPEGVCTPVAAGTDPENECTMEATASCGTTGECSGSSSSCEVYAAGTVCMPGGCMDNTINNEDQCDGQGTCVDNGGIDCGLFSCVDTVCNSVCVTTADCASTAYCNVPTGNCVPKKINGAPAFVPEECVSDFVADNVCCDTVCNLGVCDACSVSAGATVDGTCQSVGGSCDDTNSCTSDMCDPVLGCVSESLLDGTPCEGGICVAASCIPDASNSASSASATVSGSGGSTAATGGTGAGVPSNEFGIDGVPELEGGGVCTAAAPRPTRLPNSWLAVLGLAGLGLFRRRR